MRRAKRTEHASSVPATNRRASRPARSHAARDQGLRTTSAFEACARESSASVILRARGTADNALRWIRRVYPKLPDRLRYVGPYQEAQARLRGEPQPDWMTRCLNRAWIGRPQMDVRGKG